MVKNCFQFPNTDDKTYHKQNLVTAFSIYMDETSKPEYADNKFVTETRALIFETEKAGDFQISSDLY